MGQPTGEGASGTDPNAQSGGTGTPAGDGTAGTGASGTPTGASGTDSAGGGQSATFTQAEYDALKARMQAADKRASDTEAALKQLRDKDLPEQQKLQRDLQEAQATNAQMKSDIDALRIENAFLTDNTHKWRNPATALKLLDRSKVTIDSDGVVSGLKDALAALAKSDAYLLEPATPEGQGGQPQGTPPLGTPPANGGVGGNGGKPSTDQLAKRFPAIKTRLG